ncbi:MAG TPA: ABC transporter ATP-binding protein [Streptosporangiaceae bacterium]
MTIAAADAGPAAADTAVLAIKDLRKNFGGVLAVDGVSFTARRGEVTGLIGPNGAGKSTALGMIAGSVRPTAGQVLLNGVDIAGLPSYQVARRGVGRTFQLSSEFPHMTVLENMLTAVQGGRGDTLRSALLGKRYWRQAEDANVRLAAELMDRFSMTAMANELAGTLSGGQRRLLEIMRALMARPRLLLLDEPMAGVNPALSQRIQEYLLELRSEGLQMLMVEHEMSVVERLCDHVIVMAQGRVLADGTLTEIRSDRRVLDAYLAG